MTDILQKCHVCGGLIDEEDIFCANCGTAAPQDARGEQLSQAATHQFECRGCGASMSYDASAQTLRCPFCGSAQLDAQSVATSLAPSRLVPFQLSHESAIAALRRWLGHGFWRPSDLSRSASVANMTAVYVPYWVFSALTHTYWTADSAQTPFGARGDWCPVTGEHRGNYAGILIGASGALTPRETEAICPFDLAAAVPAASVDLENQTVEQFTVPRKYARPQARRGLENLESQACASRYLPGRHRNLQVNVRIEHLTSEPILLPVWIMAYRYKGQLYRLLLNGQTGKCTGEAPFSYLKLALLIFFIILVVAFFFGLAMMSG